MAASMKSFCRILSTRYKMKTYLVLSRLASQSSNERKPQYIESKEDYKYVEKILPLQLIPEPPVHESYPTPSGWFPPTEEATQHPYFIQRTANHMYPVYEKIKFTNQYLTQIKKIDGDIWLLEADLKAFLKMKLEKTVVFQVHEISRSIWIKGHYADLVCEFMQEKGF